MLREDDARDPTVPFRYNGKVEQLRLNRQHAAVLCGGVVVLHEIEPPRGGSAQRRTFPDADAGDDATVCATALALTKDVLVYGTQAGAVHFFAVDPESWAPLPGVELRHGSAIAALYPNAAGTRVAVVDANRAGFVYNPVGSELTPIPAFPRDATSVLWDCVDRHVLLVSDGKELHTYAYAPQTVRGPVVAKLGPVDVDEAGGVTMTPKATPVQQGLYPICAADGTITCQVATGSVTTIQCPLYAAPSGTRRDEARSG